MRITVLLTTLACVLGLSGTGRAAQIASPTIYGATSQKTAQCTIGNLGTTPVSVTVNIVDESGAVVSTDSHCGIVEPSFLCQVAAIGIPTGSAFACTAKTSGSTAKLRGSFSLISSAGLPLRSVELR